MKWWTIYTNTNLMVNAIVRLLHPCNGYSKGQETFSASSAYKQAHNYDIECSNHHPSLKTLRSKGLSCSKMKWWAIYKKKNLAVNVIVSLPHPRSRDSQGQEAFLVPSVDEQTRNCDIECWNHHPSLTNLRSKGLSRSKVKWWAIYINKNLPVNAINIECFIWNWIYIHTQ